MLRKSLSQDFETLFKDTENNISAIKRQLAVDHERNQYPPRSPVHGSLTSTSHLTSFNHLKSPHNYSPQTSSQTTLITSMFTRLEEQSKTIALLEKMIHKQNEEIQKIKDRQKGIRTVMRRNNNDADGADFQSKLESVERELRAEMDLVRNSIRSSKQLNEEQGSLRNDLFGDIKLQRRIIEGETKSLKMEVDNLKSRIERVELDVNVSVRDTHSVNRKYVEIERDVSDMISNQRSLKEVTDRGEGQLQNIKRELKEISSILCSVHKSENVSVDDIKPATQTTKTDSKDISNSRKVVEIADSPSSTLSMLSLISDSNNNLSFNSLDLSDVEKLPSVKESASKYSVGDTKHTSLLDDDDDELPGFNSIDDENLFIVKDGNDLSFKLSDEDDSVTLDDLLQEEL